MSDGPIGITPWASSPLTTIPEVFLRPRRTYRKAKRITKPIPARPPRIPPTMAETWLPEDLVERLTEPGGRFTLRLGKLQEYRKKTIWSRKEYTAHPKARKAKAAPMAGLAVPVVSRPSIALYVDGFAYGPVFMNDLAWTVVRRASRALLTVEFTILAAVRRVQSSGMIISMQQGRGKQRTHEL